MSIVYQNSENLLRRNIGIRLQTNTLMVPISIYNFIIFISMKLIISQLFLGPKNLSISMLRRKKKKNIELTRQVDQL